MKAGIEPCLHLKAPKQTGHENSALEPSFASQQYISVGYYYKEDKEHEDKYSSTETIRELLTIKIPERKKRDGMDDLAITLGGTTVSVRTNPVRIEEPHEEDDYDDDYEDEDCW